MGDHLQCHPRAMSIDGTLNLPPGFRFYPKDGELIAFYLTPKVQEKSFTCIAIGEVDLNNTEPWDLPNKAKIGEKEWYFFSQKDRKYSTGSRTNRATKGGYWKATGKDKEIYRAITGKVLPVLVGMRKTLVFYKGRAPKGEKTNWIMHEYRLEGKDKLSCPTSSSTSTATMKSSSTSEDEWVVCRVFKKTTGIKKSPTPPPYNTAIASSGIDQSSIPMPLPLQFPMLPDFTMDPAGSYYSTTGMSSSLVPPMIPPMVGMGSNVLQMNSTFFGNPMAISPPMPFNPMSNAPPMSSFNPMANAPPMSFNPMDIAPPMPLYHQVGIGTVGANGFMAAMESGPSLMVSQKDTGMSIDQTNSGIALESTTTMDLDGLLEILRSQVG